MTVSVLLATTGRPERALGCLRSLHESTKGHDLEVVAAVDADRETVERISGLVSKLVWSAALRGCSAAWNSALAESTGDPVVLAADDLVFEPGWLDAALETLQEFEDGWGFVGFNDGQWGAELSTHYLVSRRLIVEEFGGLIAWPCYGHSFNDVEANERAKRAGRYAWCERAHVRHDHWLFGGRAQDATDVHALGGHVESERVYNARAAQGFPDDYEAVI